MPSLPCGSFILHSVWMPNSRIQPDREMCAGFENPRPPYPGFLEPMDKRIKLTSLVLKCEALNLFLRKFSGDQLLFLLLLGVVFLIVAVYRIFWVVP